ncbi:MAG: hypothetical protein E7256_05775 [Lachnospiraceae bacterium]|nr:hypothetical protein [Lachnospiraceae bacterium]
MKKKVKIIIACTILTIFTAACIGFFYFTPEGYRISVKIHGFREIEQNVYVDNEWSKDVKELRQLVGDAKERVKEFYGELVSSSVLIICDDEEKLQKLGGDHDTKTIVFDGAHSYISLSSEWLNVDIMAHEMTHAETHARLYQGRFIYKQLLPIWFDEGLAMQNDYREQYSYETWLTITNQGNDVPGVDTYDTSEKFYAGETEDRRKRYCLAGQEVRNWIEENGKDSLITMLDQIRGGSKFSELYFH